MHRSVAAFIDHLRTERQASLHTIRSYEDDLALYCSYLAEVQGRRRIPRRWIRSGCGVTRPG